MDQKIWEKTFFGSKIFIKKIESKKNCWVEQNFTSKEDVLLKKSIIQSHGCFKGVSMIFEGCFKGVLFAQKSLQLSEHKEGLFVLWPIKMLI